VDNNCFQNFKRSKLKNTAKCLNYFIRHKSSIIIIIIIIIIVIIFNIIQASSYLLTVGVVVIVEPDQIQ
jgi:hypothetical protein